MQILRPPPGSEGSEETQEVAPAKNRFLHFFFAALFLVIGMVIFFVGGVVVRNPELPNYLLDQIVTRFRGTPNTQGLGNQQTSVQQLVERHAVGGVATGTPPPPPQTAEEYLDLMSYDENILSPDQRNIVSILNQTVPAVLIESPPTMRFSEGIIPEIRSLKPGDDVTRVRTMLQECRDLVGADVRGCQNGADQLEGKLTAAGLVPTMAHEVAVAFARRPLTRGTVYWPDELNRACDDAATLIDVLSTNPSKWKRNEDGSLSFATQALAERFNTASKDLTAALNAAAHIIPRSLTTVEDYLNLTDYDEATLPAAEQVVASVLNQTIRQLSNTGISRWSSHLNELYNNQIMPGFQALKPGSDDTKVRSEIAECREKTNETIQIYQKLPEQLAAKLVAAGVPDSLSRQIAESFAQRANARRNLTWAANLNLCCDSVTKLMDLLSKNPSKWRRDAEGKILFTSSALLDKFNAVSQELNSAIKGLNSG